MANIKRFLGRNALQLGVAGAVVAGAGATALFSSVPMSPVCTTGYGNCPPPPTSGYRVLTSNGSVYSYGNAVNDGSPAAQSKPGAPFLSMVQDPATTGYWVLSSKGNVDNYNAPWYGSPAINHPGAYTVGIASTMHGNGYWVLTSTGNVFNYGTAGWHGSPAAEGVRNVRFVAIGMSPSGHGYWLLTAAGNVFNFGSGTPWLGSPAAAHSGGMPYTGLTPSAPSSTGGSPGYYVIGAGGNIYNYGSAVWNGSPAASRLGYVGASGILADSTGGGYWVTTYGGSVINYGDAKWYGSPRAAGANTGAVTAITG